MCFILGGVLTNITHPRERKNSETSRQRKNSETSSRERKLSETNNKLTNTKPKIDKKEDAPLMDNEYRLGTTTPVMPTPALTPIASKSPTVENISQIGKSEY